MTFTHALGTNNYGESKFIVSSSAANGTHTTIAAALTAASSGDTIFVRAGTYTEDLTLKAGVDIVSFLGEGETPNVTIVGKLTASFSGAMTVSGIRLQTNSDFFLVISGSNVTSVVLTNCFLLAQNAGGISYTNTNNSSGLIVSGCSGTLNQSGVGFYTCNTSATNTLMTFEYTRINNGASTTASNINSGNINFMFCYIYFPISTSSAGTYGIYDSDFETDVAVSTALTTAGTGTSAINTGRFYTSTSSAISVGAGTTVKISNSIVNSSNANAITGAGTLNLGLVTFTGSSSTINTSTVTSLVTKVGSLTLNTPLPLTSGGTNASLTASNGGILYSTASAAAILAGTATAGQVLRSGASTTPSWATNYNISSTGVVTNTGQPLVLAQVSSTISNVTGDNTQYTVIFDTEVADQSSSYNNSTGVWTCPVTGFYLVTSTLYCTGLTASHTRGLIFLSTNTAADTTYGSVLSPGVARSSSNEYAMTLHSIVQFAVNDTLSVRLLVSGGTKVVSIYGDATNTTNLGIFLLA